MCEHETRMIITSLKFYVSKLPQNEFAWASKFSFDFVAAAANVKESTHEDKNGCQWKFNEVELVTFCGEHKLSFMNLGHQIAFFIVAFIKHQISRDNATLSAARAQPTHKT